MNIVISAYSQSFFQEYILPQSRNADYRLSLYKNELGLKQDLSVHYENVEGIWKICPDKGYRLYGSQEIVLPEELKDGQIYKIMTASREQITLLVRSAEDIIIPYSKYDISRANSITIGKDPENVIRYDFRGMVSGKHAVIQKQGRGWIIKNMGSNGIYINSSYVQNSKELVFGDFINIIGLHIVFLGDYLAVDLSHPGVAINSSILVRLELKKKTSGAEERNSDKAQVEPEAPQVNTKLLFHRSPRNLEKIDTEAVEIEAPPASQKTKKQPLLLTIGPSFTMAIPMLLGSLLMIYASRSAGSNTGLFMYTGLVMAGSSAVIGVGWALANLRYQKKNEMEEELHRFDAYGKYLADKTEEVRQKYETNSKALHSMYPEASVVAGYNENTPELWNRNTSHSDFLSVRLGLGDLPFQTEIQIPKKKFSLNPDALEEKPDLIRENFKTLYKVPVLIDIKEHPITGIVGGRDKKGAIEAVRILCAQIAASHCYTDVKMVFIYDETNSNDAAAWDFAKWFPHTWSEDRKTRYVASEKSEISDVCYELTKIFRQRFEEHNEKESESVPKPYYILFLSDPTLMEDELLAKYVFDKDEGIGLSVFILSDTFEHLPNSCDYIIQNDESFQGVFDASAQKDERIAITFDSVRADSLEVMARHMSNIEVQELETGGEIPSSLTFLEMYGVNKPEQLGVDDRWLKNRTYENIKGLIGEKAGGTDCYLDVHEKYHGPHGLVAGTTGSGKSETLQTYMLSLALNYSPDDIGFFIIDYKGGGMANLFEGLPHLVGQISNLSGNQVHRAMVSIKSENRRRQRIFNENGVNNINAYTKLVKSKEATEPVPHLFIIIDEFAELKKEEPDFMRELISVAQVGRSLGVHLILATQKPSGTVDDNIWSNAKFRLCLRVQDKEDSMDMLHKPDAAYITQAGRCYLQVGSDEVYELFQSGWSGAPYDENVDLGSTDIARLLTLSGRTDVAGSHIKTTRKAEASQKWIECLLECIEEASSLSEVSVEDASNMPDSIKVLLQKVFEVIAEKEIDYPVSRYNAECLTTLITYSASVPKSETRALDILKEASEAGAKLPLPKEKTQLDAVIEYLSKAAEKGAYDKMHQLWMPVLPEYLYLDEFEEFNQRAFDKSAWPEQNNTWSLETIIGRFDDPANQAQVPAKVSFSEGGHLAVIGSVVSGKSTFIQSLLYALTATYSPQYFNFYGIDFSSKMLAGFERSPHCGGIAFEGENERIAKLFHLLSEMLENRKKLFRGGNYSQYVQTQGVSLPAIILVIDNFSAFNEKTENLYESDVITLAKEGVSQGIYLVISAGGYSMNELPGRIAENMKSAVCLEMPDKFAYGDILHTMKIDVLPESGIKGRGLAYCEGQILEFQTALALRAGDDYQRMEQIAAREEEMALAWKGSAPRKIPEIPDKPTWASFSDTEEVRTMAEDPARLPVGYDMESAQIYGIDLSSIYCYLIAGAVRTGKRNFMKIMIQASRMKSAEIFVIDPNGDMNVFEDCEDVKMIRDLEELYLFMRDTLTPAFQTRNKIKKEAEAQGAEDMELFEASLSERPMFIYITDLPWFIENTDEDERGMTGLLQNLLQKGRFHNIYFVAILPIERRTELAGYPVFSDFIAYKTGIHFGGNAVQNTFLNFDYLGYQKQSVVLKPGIGMLPDILGEHETESIMVPLAKWKK